MCSSWVTYSSSQTLPYVERWSSVLPVFTFFYRLATAFITGLIDGAFGSAFDDIADTAFEEVDHCIGRRYIVGCLMKVTFDGCRQEGTTRIAVISRCVLAFGDVETIVIFRKQSLFNP
ncbi:hypothetical protein HAPAU_36540 [Halalkalicoccus paucihalophilus]|uniref:Uncharacterized protein n=1 Tax=Halalkalicoccus paucihalophilus TaxID=1008153 RepID=A0A151AAF7_9EURY|nr:hypothetical protein HAPAU_36540 [Halalkalicoccus paucihalophilus]